MTWPILEVTAGLEFELKLGFGWGDCALCCCLVRKFELAQKLTIDETSDQARCRFATSLSISQHRRAQHRLSLPTPVFQLCGLGMGSSLQAPRTSLALL